MKDDREIAVARPTPPSTRMERPKLILRKRQKRDQPIAVKNEFAEAVSFRAFDILSLRFALWAIAQVGLGRGEHREQHVAFRANVRDFAKLLGIEWYRRNVQAVRRAILGLAKVHFSLPEHGGIWDVPLVAGVYRPTHITEDGIIEIKFNPLLFEFFNRDENGRFALLQVEDIFKVRSPRAANAIMLLSYMRHLKSKELCTLPLDQIRFVLDLEDPSYDRWDNVAAVLRRVRADIHRNTKWRFDVLPEKNRGKVVCVRIRVRECVRFTNLGHRSAPRNRLSLASPVRARKV